MLMAMRVALRFLLSLAAALLSAVAQAAPAPQSVELALQSGVQLRAWWLPAEGAGLHPAVLALHGCGGLYAKSGKLAERYRETFAHLHAAGVSVLMPDSFGSRDIKQYCQTRYAERTLKVADRAHDAAAGLAWLAAQPQVDARRIGVLGWSNGATTTLNLLAQRAAQADAKAPRIAGAAVFYPGCRPLLRRHATLENVPLLMQMGALDDWTPAAPCEAYVAELQKQPGSDVTLHVYEGSYHDFDSKAPVRLRTDVSNGVSSAGVHQGGNPQARAQALAALDTFWSRVLGVHLVSRNE